MEMTLLSQGEEEFSKVFEEEMKDLLIK